MPAHVNCAQRKSVTEAGMPYFVYYVTTLADSNQKTLEYSVVTHLHPSSTRK